MVAIWDCDVLVIGSGCAGMIAALRLAASNLSVLVLEKTEKFGGTSAMSGAGIWCPANPAMLRAGLPDSVDDGIAYIRAVSPPGWQEKWDRHWQRLVSAGPEMIDFIESETPLRFTPSDEPDPYLDAPGAKSKGRMISVQTQSRWRLGRRAFELRRSTLPEIFTYHEAVGADLFHHPLRTIMAMLPQLSIRYLCNSAGRGQALMTGLTRACMDHGVEIRTKAPATGLILEDSAVVGATVGGDRPGRILARRGVLVASGGFEWDEEMRSRHFPGVNGYNASSPGNSGDGQKMGQAIGASLDNMEEATIHPCLPVRYEGRVQGVPLPFQTEPNSIVVNATGRRFVNEQAFNIGVHLNKRDASTGMPLHLPAWVISDSDYLRRLPVVRWYLRANPEDLVRAPTIRELARKIGVSEAALLESVDMFNSDCAQGKDRLFGRSNRQAAPTDTRRRAGMAPIRKPPFVAVRLGRAFLGTKGGLGTDERGRVLDAASSIIPGLYAAGACSANPIGTKAVGIGTTVGPYMAAGYICALDILGCDLSQTSGKTG